MDFEARKQELIKQRDQLLQQIEQAQIAIQRVVGQLQLLEEITQENNNG